MVAPTGRDAELLASILTQNGFEAGICRDMAALSTALQAGGAVAIVAEEALGSRASERLSMPRSRLNLPGQISRSSFCWAAAQH